MQASEEIARGFLVAGREAAGDNVQGMAARCTAVMTPAGSPELS
jgi:hypothetical protein